MWGSVASNLVNNTRGGEEDIAGFHTGRFCENLYRHEVRVRGVLMSLIVSALPFSIIFFQMK